MTREGFLLVRSWRDTQHGILLELWGCSSEGPLCIRLRGQKAVLFVRSSTKTSVGERRAVPLKSLDGAAVDALYFPTQRELLAARQKLLNSGIEALEADVKPVERFLMERFILGSFSAKGTGQKRGGVFYMDNPRLTKSETPPQLSALSIDIETDGLEGPLLSIAGATSDRQQVFLVGSSAKDGKQRLPPWVTCHENEGATLDAFFAWVEELDPDLILGWNVVDFDLRYLAALCKRLKKAFRLGRGGGKAEILEAHSKALPRIARIPGRVVLDGIATLKSATMRFESFALNEVAHELLGRRKKIDKGRDPVEEIRRMAKEDPLALAEYNLEDCRLVLDIFAKAKLIQFAVERQQLTGLPMDRQGGSVAAFDQLYLPRLHRKGYVAPSVGHRAPGEGSPGGYVMESKPGLYKNVLVLDFKSLYPSIIRTFCVDPLGLARGTKEGIAGFEGAYFSREGHILPEMIRTMWQARDRAKSDKNWSLSQAIKIMMNSFYGVLGTPGCRFYDRRLVSSITLRGHDILGRSRSFLESQDLEVIYGDTDSVFVLLAADLDAEHCQARGKLLAQELTSYFRNFLLDTMNIESHLELEFETHFHRFLMPTIRGSDVGTKKRYAGSVFDREGKMSLVFKGLEAVRTDWTPLARRFQRELYRRAFSDEPYESFVCDIARDLKAGLLDEELVYTKRLRRQIHEYENNVPPHVQAARQLPNPGRQVSYLITTQGPQPIEKITSPLDYEHYLARQIAPAADGLLHFLGTSFEELAGAQMSFF